MTFNPAPIQDGIVQGQKVTPAWQKWFTQLYSQSTTGVSDGIASVNDIIENAIEQSAFNDTNTRRVIADQTNIFNSNTARVSNDASNLFDVSPLRLVSRLNTWLRTQIFAVGTATQAPVQFQTGTLITSPVNGSLEFDGTFFYLTTNGVRRKLNGQAVGIADFYATVGNTASTFTPLYSVLIPSGYLLNNGDKIAFEYGGLLANNTNGKLVSVQFGTTVISSTGTVTTANSYFRINGTIIRSSASSITYNVAITTTAGTYLAEGSLTGISLSGNSLTLYGQSVAAADVSAYNGYVIYRCAA